MEKRQKLELFRKNKFRKITQKKSKNFMFISDDVNKQPRKHWKTIYQTAKKAKNLETTLVKPKRKHLP